MERKRCNRANSLEKNNDFIIIKMKLFCGTKAKTYVISEEQIKYYKEHLLNEAMDNTFSFDTLDKLPSFNKRVQYCKTHMGMPIGSGSSRIVFQIDDEKVLKLAKNEKGIAQNNVEADWVAQNYGVLPKLYRTSQDCLYIVTEYVLPAKAQDFKHCLGMTFEEFCTFIRTCFYGFSNDNVRRWIRNDHLDDNKFRELLDSNEWLNAFYTYILDYQPMIGDLIRIVNYGICQRNGKTEIVLLDSGFNKQVYDDYYNRKSIR